MPRIVIVGAGISGLAAAYRIRQRLPDADVTVLERDGRPGGTVWTERRDGFQVEIGPNGFLDSKPTTLALCRDLGLGDELVPATEAAGKNRYLFLGGRLRLLPNSLPSFLTSDLLSVRGKLGFLAERFRRGPRGGPDESVRAFARRRAGDEVADVFADALVTGIYAGDPDRLSIRATFPRLVDFEERYGSVLKGFAQTARLRRQEAAARGEPPPRRGQMWSFRDGLRRLIETLHDQLRQPPVLGVGVRSVKRGNGDRAWEVHGDGQERWPADAVLLTCPAYQQAAMVADLDSELAERVGGIVYNRVAVVALGYARTDVPHPLAGFGYIAPQRTRRDLLGVQWCSSVFPGRAPDGSILLRALCGGWQRPEVVGWDDGRFIEAVRAELKLALGVAAAPQFHSITRWDRAIPQYHLSHLERVTWIEERLRTHPGLFLGGNSYRGVALNDCTEQAESHADTIQRYLAGR